MFSITQWLAAQGLPAATNLTAHEVEIIEAARISAAPRFNGAGMIATYPESPLTYSLTVSGQAPITYSARHMPPGLRLDPQTGIVAGTLAKPGEYHFTAIAKNASGKAKAEIKI
ncbi:MAG TPA: Ig domain-containing protein, partial [Candidatus Acidoferrum sp.]|nr:Ig domain-containing protein [Candidatus Acidoferrum sp.]